MGPPYQSSMSERAIDEPIGSKTSPEATWSRSSARVNHAASVTSTPSTVMSVVRAWATKPNMSDAGNGQGWLPLYVTPPTSIELSSSTSRRTAASRPSPGST